MDGSYVVTGGGRGVGRAIAERLISDGGSVVIIEMDEAALRWIPGHRSEVRLSGVTGNAAGRADGAGGRRVDRERVEPPGPAGGAGRAALRDGQGGGGRA